MFNAVDGLVIYLEQHAITWRACATTLTCVRLSVTLVDCDDTV